MKHRTLLLSVLLGLQLAVTPATAQDAPAAAPQSLIAALEALREQGLELIYSEALVRPWMTVRPGAPAGPPEARLAALLDPHGLVAVPGGDSVWLVTRSPDPRIKTGALFGQVMHNGVPVTDVQVALVGTNRVTTTNGGGHYSIDNVDPGVYTVQASSYGYMQNGDTRVDIVAGRPRWQQIEVSPAPVTLDQVAVVASKYRLLASQQGRNVFLTREEVDRLPHLGDDLHRAIKLMPGTAGNDFTGRTNLRGGVADETAVRLDNLELIDPFHLKDLGGGLGSVDSELIKGVDLISGGFGAELGNASSGFIDAHTIEPTGEPETSVGVSFINAFIRNQGGFDNGNGGWLVSLRRGYLDFLLDQIKTGADEIRPRYWDFLTKADYRFSDSLKLTADVFVTRDDTVVKGDDAERAEIEANSRYAWVTATLDPTSDLHGDITVSTGSTDEDREALSGMFNLNVSDVDDELDLWFTGLRSDWTWLAGSRQLYRFGGELRHLEADYDYLLTGSTFSEFSPNGSLVHDRRIRKSVDGNEYSIWGAWRVQPVDPLTAEVGLRWDKQTYTSLSENDQVSPRASLAWEFDEDTRVRAAWGYYHQPQRIHELNVEDGEDFFYKAQRAEHRVLGLDQAFGNGISMRVDVYQKKYEDVIPRYENLFDPLEQPAEAQPDRVRIAPKRAEAKGLELSLKGTWRERIDWWGSYTYSDARDRIDGRNQPRSWDQRHATNVGINWRGEKWNLSFVHTYHSGWPRTDATFERQTNDNGDEVFVIVPGPRNDDNFEGYHRLDMRASRRVIFPRGILRYYFELYNIYDRKNECCVQEFQIREDSNGELFLKQEPEAWLPFIPSFGVSYTFK